MCVTHEYTINALKELRTHLALTAPCSHLLRTEWQVFPLQAFGQTLKLGRPAFSQRPQWPGSCREVALCHFPTLELLFSAGCRLEVGRLIWAGPDANFPDLKSHSLLSLPSNEIGDVHQMTVLKTIQSCSLNPISGWIWKECFQTRSRLHLSGYAQADLLAFKRRETLKLTSWLSKGERKNTPTLSITLEVALRGLRRRLSRSLSHRHRPCSQGGVQTVHPLGNPRFSWVNPRASYLSGPLWTCLTLVQGGPPLATVFPRSWVLEGPGHSWYLQTECAMYPRKDHPVWWCSGQGGAVEDLSLSPCFQDEETEAQKEEVNHNPDKCRSCI